MPWRLNIQDFFVVLIVRNTLALRSYSLLARHRRNRKVRHYGVQRAGHHAQLLFGHKGKVADDVVLIYKMGGILVLEDQHPQV